MEYYKQIVEKVPTYTRAWKMWSANGEISTVDVVNNIDQSLNCNSTSVKDEKISNLLVLSLQGLSSGYRDVMFIHELVHAIELNVGSDGIARCGLQAFELDQHTALNETKTQLIAMKIAENLHQKGIYFFESPEATKARGGTVYEREGEFVELFMKKFEKDILEVGMTGNMEGFINKIGKKNFEKFSNAIDEHSKISIYQHRSARDSQDPNHPINYKIKHISNRVQDALEGMAREAFGMPNGMER